MATYQVDLEDGSSYEVDVDEPQSKRNLLRIGAEKVGRAVGIKNIPSLNQMAESGHPYLAASLGTAKDLATIPTHFTNQYLMNYPRSLANQSGIELPTESESPVANTLAKGAGIAGGLLSPINKLAGLKVLQGTPMATKMIMGAGIGAAYAPNEGIGNLKQRRDQALIGGFAPPVIQGGARAAGAVGTAISKIPQYTENVAGGIVNRIIKALPKDFSFGRNPGLGIAQEGITANSADDLLTKTRTARQSLGRSIGKTLSFQKTPVSIKRSLIPIDVAMGKAAQRNDQALVTRLSEAKRAITQNLELDKSVGQDVIRTSGDRNITSLLPEEAAKIKTMLGEMVKWTENHSNDTIVNKAIRQSYRIIDHTLDNAVPGIRQLNNRYANLLTAEHSAQKYLRSEQAQGGLRGILGHAAPAARGAGAAILSALTHVGNPTLIGFGVTAMEEAIKTPAIGTRVAKWLIHASEAEKATLWKNNPKIKQAMSQAFYKSKNLMYKIYGR